MTDVLAPAPPGPGRLPRLLLGVVIALLATLGVTAAAATGPQAASQAAASSADEAITVVEERTSPRRRTAPAIRPRPRRRAVALAAARRLQADRGRWVAPTALGTGPPTWRGPPTIAA